MQSVYNNCESEYNIHTKFENRRFLNLEMKF